MNVGEQDMDGSGPELQQMQGSRGMVGLQDFKALLSENVGHQHAYQRLVFCQQGCRDCVHGVKSRAIGPGCTAGSCDDGNRAKNGLATVNGTPINLGWHGDGTFAASVH
jgi:hypothetical protein